METTIGYDDEEIEEANSVIRLAEKLIVSISVFFPTQAQRSPNGEVTFLHHDDMNWHNTLVDADDQGVLIAILDWNVFRLYPCGQYPLFLRG